MDFTPRNQFNRRLADRYWDIPTTVPQATHLNTPIGTHFCDQLGFMCHPQEYRTFHNGGQTYKDIDTESALVFSLDYYNPYDIACHQSGQLSPQLIQTHFQNSVMTGPCPETPKVWRNHSKLHKFNMPY